MPAPAASLPAKVAAILAGGAGSRLGKPKAAAEVAAVPLIDRVLEAVAQAGLRGVVVAKADSELPATATPVLREPAEPRHPLVGLITALRKVDAPVVALGCDTPFLPPALLERLATLEADAAVVETDGRMHPLIARYSTGALEPLESSLEAEHSLTAAVQRLSPVIVGEEELRAFGDPARITFNVNTPEDLARAEELAGGGEPAACG